VPKLDLNLAAARGAVRPFAVAAVGGLALAYAGAGRAGGLAAQVGALNHVRAQATKIAKREDREVTLLIRGKGRCHGICRAKD